MIKLNRCFTNQTLFLNFVKCTVVCTRFCSDKKPFLEDILEEKKKNKKETLHASENEKEEIEKKKKTRKKLFSILQDDEKKAKAKESLNRLLKTVNVEAVKKSEDQSSTSSESKITLPLPQKKPSRPKRNKKKTSRLLHQKISESINEVAKELPGDIKQTKSDLLTKIKELLDTERGTITKQVRKKHKINELLTSIDRIEKDDSSKLDKINTLYSNEEPLGIFSADFQPSQENEVKLKIWDELEKEHLKFLFSSAPKNYFEELILWTEEGKLWHFPIDNEQGLDEEAKVDFTEHVFLEEHLEPWCPKAGPLRHFMELVITGLSKNPYLTVKDKHEHIYWYRDYFENKKKLLLSLGAYDKKPVADK